MSMTRADRRAQRGAQLLSIHRPGWEQEIELDILYMGSCVNCVLGQLYHSYEHGVEELNLQEQEAYFGFDVDDDITYRDLDKSWTKILTKFLANPTH